jgi:hypothetical protein
VHNLADARETCEQCHWPEKHLGTKLKVKPHYRTDETTSGYTNVLLMRTGGTRADGAAVGIHWHTHPDALVEYVAADEQRTQIPWLRVKRPDGTQDVYAVPGVPHDPPPSGELRRMDCNDCHNRSAHAFELPDQALDAAFAAGLLPRDLPSFKKHALDALLGEWTRDGAADGIRKSLQAAYAANGQLDATTMRKLESAIEHVVAIWRRNVYPDRKLTWNSCPDLATHFGCFRCHDGRHATADGRVVFGPPPGGGSALPRDSSCDRCHVVLSENEEDPAVLEALGLRR